jgi:hypothetical protein
MRVRHVVGLLLLGLAGCASAAGEDGPQAVYCYRTLADIDCHTGRDRLREGRLVGVYLRTPPPDGLPMRPMPPLP